MTTSAAQPASDRSDFRTVIGAGAKSGGVTALAVVLFLVSTRALPPGAVRSFAQALIALATALAAAFLPARWAVPRTTEGVAGCAAIGLWGTIVFSAIDIALFRPLKAYPWTWDAIGGGATWWYLPMWWMLGTYLAWMGGLRWAAMHARGEVTLGRAALPVVVGAALLAAVTTILRPGVPLPVAVGGGFALTLTVLAVADVARKR
jgi:hypothetical protein